MKAEWKKRLSFVDQELFALTGKHVRYAVVLAKGNEHPPRGTYSTEHFLFFTGYQWDEKLGITEASFSVYPEASATFENVEDARSNARLLKNFGFSSRTAAIEYSKNMPKKIHLEGGI
jgi:hypothetical protein